MPDRRASPSAWSDPRLYVSLLGVLLTVGIYFLNGINNKLQTIDATAQRIDRATATQAADIQSLRRELDQAKNDVASIRDIHNADNAAVREKIVRLEAQQQGRK